MRLKDAPQTPAGIAQPNGGQPGRDLGGQMCEIVDHGELAEISQALDELEGVEPDLAEIVDLKFFCGLTFGEIAALRVVSERTVQRNWEKARIYLHRKLRTDLAV